MLSARQFVHRVTPTTSLTECMQTFTSQQQNSLNTSLSPVSILSMNTHPQRDSNIKTPVSVLIRLEFIEMNFNTATQNATMKIISRNIYARLFHSSQYK